MSKEVSVQIRLRCKNLEDGSVSEFIGTPPMTIGRSNEFSDVVILDKGISRQHARLELVQNNLIVHDLNSSNGTYVNGELVQSTTLKKGDIITIAFYEIAWTYIHPESSNATIVQAVPSGLKLARKIPEPLSQPEPIVPAPQPAVIVPARKVIEEATAYNREHGHENEGFLSTEYGFLPVEPPLLQLPESHHLWDDMIAELPDLFRTLTLRRAFNNLPLLDVTPDALPDKYLMRASTILGVFAHSYQYVETDPPPALPDNIMKPWLEVSRRLGKPIPYLSYIDLFLYNWRLRDASGPRRLDNMDVMVPTWKNEAERVFYLVTIEMVGEFTPILNAMLKAQEAVVQDNRVALEEALLVILDRLQFLTQVIYPQIDPNAYSKSFVDQVVWAKTVGTFGVAVLEGAPSPSGTAQPATHALDAFLGRQSYDTLVGKQSVYLNGHSRRHWQELVEALRQISVAEYVEKSQHTALRGLFNNVIDAFAGDKGFLGVHRIKAWGFLEIAFKVGRSVTTGARFSGLFRDKTWEKIDKEIESVRDERYPLGNQHVYWARPKQGIVSTEPETGAWINFIELDVTNQGIHYQPGDRVGILTENSDALVNKTLKALQATGDEIVHLTPQWQQAIRLRSGYSDDVKVIPLRAVLSYGKIRPVTRDIAKLLLRITASGTLKRISEARMEDQWELWDVLNLVFAGGYDVTRLWKAGPWDADNICRVIPPEVFRLYSIASAPDDNSSADKLQLIVGGLDYTTPHTPYSYMQRRGGTASHFLRRVTTEVRYRDKQLSVALVPTARFHLPDNPARPVIMFAAGSGLAPFNGFLETRMRQTGADENWLFFGTRTPDEFFNREQLETWSATGRLQVRVAFSRAGSTASFDTSTGRFVIERGHRQRINDVIEADPNAVLLWNFLRSKQDGGRDGVFYVCGRTGFAASVMEALKNVVRRFTGGSEEEVNTFFRRLMAEGRYLQDIFTTYTGNAQEGQLYNISDLVLHNNDADGHWMAISGKVYDMTEFMHQHVGGARIITCNTGMDATAAYQGVLHHINSEVDALLGMLELGVMRRLQFGDVWAVILTPDGLRFMLLEDMFKAWVRYLYLVVGMEDALENDYSFERTVSISGETADEMTPYKMQYLIEAHRRFLVSYLDGLVDEDVQTIWAITIGFCNRDQDVRTLKAELDTVTVQPAYHLVRNSITYVKRALFALQDTDELQTQKASLDAIRSLCTAFKEEDLKLLSEIKYNLREGILAFEQFEASVIVKASGSLMEVVKQIPGLVGAYYERLAERITATGISVEDIPADVDPEPIPSDGGIPGHGGKL
ncbi:MAG: FHA domain-containing protein [Chloroflexota bacterium]